MTLLRWAEVDLRALADNVAAVRARMDAQTLLLAVVKADAYGHGAVPVSHAVLAAGASWLGVATVPEAAALREGGVDAPLLVMGPVPTGLEADAVALGARLTVYEPGSIERLGQVAARGDPPVRLHLKVDTGMARLGCAPGQALGLARQVLAEPGLQLEGLWTHFAQADDADATRSEVQLQKLLQVADDLAAAGIRPPILHAANSAATLLLPPSRLALVRCGLPLYGYASTAVPLEGLRLRPVLTWKSRVVALHDLVPGDCVGYGGTFVADHPMRTATVATGYADGYRRELSNRGAVLVRDRRAPLVGRVSMDYLTVDVSDIPGVALDDEVVLLGTQGGEVISADDLAGSLHTICWEVLTSIGPRVERLIASA